MQEDFDNTCYIHLTRNNAVIGFVLCFESLAEYDRNGHIEDILFLYWITYFFSWPLLFSLQ